MAPNATVTPLDVFGSWVKQEVFRELEQLELEVAAWLRDRETVQI